MDLHHQIYLNHEFTKILKNKKPCILGMPMKQLIIWKTDFEK